MDTLHVGSTMEVIPGSGWFRHMSPFASIYRLFGGHYVRSLSAEYRVCILCRSHINYCWTN